MRTTGMVSYLIKQIRHELLEGKINTKNANDVEKTLCYWKVGKLIEEHMDSLDTASTYGQNIMKHISESVEIAQRTLYNIYRFYKTYPGKRYPNPGLTWTHYQKLSTVKDEAFRKKLLSMIIREGLSVRELSEYIKMEKGITKNNASSLIEHLGNPYQYRVKKKSGSLYLDCGFNVLKKLPESLAEKYNPEDIIKTEKKYRYKKIDLPYDRLYTFKANFNKATDGDTIRLDIDLGFDLVLTRKIRLRGINTPDILSEEGLQARNYVSRCLKRAGQIWVKTYRRDLFDRYLGDIYYGPENLTAEEFATASNWLNRRLVEKGHAQLFKY